MRSREDFRDTRFIHAVGMARQPSKCKQPLRSTGQHSRASHIAQIVSFRFGVLYPHTVSELPLKISGAKSSEHRAQLNCLFAPRHACMSLLRWRWTKAVTQSFFYCSHLDWWITVSERYAAIDADTHPLIIDYDKQWLNCVSAIGP